MKELSLYHIVREPKNTAVKAPLLILVHGYGSNEEDLFSFASELPEEYFIISVRAPHELPPYGNAWYAINFDADENKFSDIPQAIASRDLIVQFIDEVIETYAVDSSSVTLVGFSQGAILSYAVALSFPEKVSRVVALSGYLNTDILKENFEQNDFSQLKIYTSHGTVDQVIPIEWAQKAPVILKTVGIETIYKEYPAGHGVTPQNFYDFKQFLIDTKK